MESNKKGLANLTKKALAVIGGALAALNGTEANSPVMSQNENFESKSIQVKEMSRTKPMPILKLNMENPENSQFVASHTSHRSHNSRRSHYSHRSGAMFS